MEKKLFSFQVFIFKRIHVSHVLSKTYDFFCLFIYYLIWNIYVRHSFKFMNCWCCVPHMCVYPGLLTSRRGSGTLSTCIPLSWSRRRTSGSSLVWITTSSRFLNNFFQDFHFFLSFSKFTLRNLRSNFN